MDQYHQHRDLVLRKSHWIKDKTALNCHNCAKPFSTFRRRHHCRFCGLVFCSECTDMSEFNGIVIRTCSSCLQHYDFSNTNSVHYMTPRFEALRKFPSRPESTRALSFASNSIQSSLFPSSNYSTTPNLLSLIGSLENVQIDSTSSNESETVPMILSLDPVCLTHLWDLLDQLVNQLSLKKKSLWIKTLKSLISQIPSFSMITSDMTSAIKNYVKIKKFIGPSPSSTEFLKGLSFCGSCLGSSQFEINSPHILLTDFSLNAPVSEDLQSFDQVLNRGAEFSESFIAKVMQLSPSPDILVCTSSVSDNILQKLSQLGITVISNTKQKLIYQLSKLTSGDIVTSSSSITRSNLGVCHLFKVRQLSRSDQRLTLTFLQSNSSFAGTILLTDTSLTNLMKVKGILRFMIYCLFNLKFESSFFKNSFCISTRPESGTKQYGAPYHDKISRLTNSFLSISPTVKLTVPFFLLQAAHYYELFTDLKQNSVKLDSKFDVYPQSYRKRVAAHLANKKLYDLKNKLLAINEQIEDFTTSNDDVLDLSSHQKLYYTYYQQSGSDYCTVPTVFLIEFYVPKNDCSLGQFINGIAREASNTCKECGLKQHSHTRNFVHGDRSLKVKINRIEENKDKDAIRMWSQCVFCDCKSPATEIDEGTWNLSFGKFLELCLCSQDNITMKDMTCYHDHHQSSYCFSIKDYDISFQTSKIMVSNLSIREPFDDSEISIVLKFKSFNSIKSKTNNLFRDIRIRLNSIVSSYIELMSSENLESKINDLLKSAETQKGSLLSNIDKSFYSTSVTDYGCLDLYYIDLVNYYLSWCSEFSKFEKDYLPDFLRTSLTKFETILMNESKPSPDSSSDISYRSDTYERSDSNSVSKASSTEFFASEEISKTRQLIVESWPSTDNNHSTGSPTKMKTKYTSKVSMVPKLKLPSSKVKEKIHQMEALIADQSIISPKSPSIKSPFSPTSMPRTPVIRDFEINPKKVIELKSYFDKLQDKFNKELEEQRAAESRFFKKLQSTEARYSGFESDDSMTFRLSSKSSISSSPFKGRRSFVKDSNSLFTEDKDFKDKADTVVELKSEEKHKSQRKYLEEPEEAANISGENSIDPFNDYSNDFEFKKKVNKMLEELFSKRSELIKPLKSPLGVSEHVFNGTSVIIRENEPSSIVSFVLQSDEYKDKVTNNGFDIKTDKLTSSDCLTLNYEIMDGDYRCRCKLRFVEQFQAFREKCSMIAFENSISRCENICNGKTLKTLDGKYVLRILSKKEAQTFQKIAIPYFEYMAQTVVSKLPSMMVKIFGMYQISLKSEVNSYKIDFLVMENMFDRPNTNTFHLDGKTNVSAEFPIFLRYVEHKLLQRCLWNDSLFLSRLGISNYNLTFAKQGEKVYVGIECVEMEEGDGKQYKNNIRESAKKSVICASEWYR